MDEGRLSTMPGCPNIDFAARFGYFHTVGSIWTKVEGEEQGRRQNDYINA
jgi:hypothetical protein